MCGQKVLWWTERKRKLSKQFLNFTPRAMLGLKMSRTFWRNAGYSPVAERESTKRGQLLSFPTLFILDYSNMAVNCTKASTSQSSAFVQESQIKIRAIQTKLQRLLDGYLEQDIERETYREQKAILLSEKKSLDEKMARIEQKQNDWLEHFHNWIKVASTLVKITRDNDLLQKKVIAKEIFGSNLRLARRAVGGAAGVSFLFSPPPAAAP